MSISNTFRSMFATFYREVDVKGLPGWEYRVPGELFEAPAKNKENECFCPDLKLDVCTYDGGLLLSSCQAGLFLHFSPTWLVFTWNRSVDV